MSTLPPGQDDGGPDERPARGHAGASDDTPETADPYADAAGGPALAPYEAGQPDSAEARVSQPRGEPESPHAGGLAGPAHAGPHGAGPPGSPSGPGGPPYSGSGASGDGGTAPYGAGGPLVGRSAYDRRGLGDPPGQPYGTGGQYAQYGDPAATGSFPGFPGAYPDQPVPGQPGAVAPAKPRRGRTVLILVGALVAVGAVAALGWFLFVGRADPRGTADAFLGALRSKDVAAAHGKLCADGKGKERPDDLRTDFGLDKHTITAYAITGTAESTRDGSATTVRAELTYDTGATVPVELEVVGEGGGTVCGFTIPASTG